MEWGRPDLVYLLVFPLLGFLVILYARNRRHRLLGKFAEGDILKRTGYRPPRRMLARPLLTVSGIFFITISLLQPRFGVKPDVYIVRGLDLIVCLDTSLSMLASDVVPSRFVFAKRVIEYVIDRLGNDRVGLVGFSGKAYYFCPLTVDHEAVKLYLKNLGVEAVPVPGTALENALEISEEILSEEENRYRAVLVVTDGEDHSENTLDVVRRLRKKGISVFTVGVGDAEGGPIPLGESGGKGYKKDRGGKVVITKLNRELLSRIGRVSGGGYYEATPTMETIDLLYRELSMLKRGKLKEYRVRRRKERFQIPLFIGLVLILIDSVLIERPKEENDD